MDPETVAWVLLAVGVVLAALLVVVVLAHLRRLRHERAVLTIDVTRRVARLRLLAASRRGRGSRGNRRGGAIRTP